MRRKLPTKLVIPYLPKIKTRCVSHNGPIICVISSMGMHEKITYLGKKKNSCP